MKSRYEYCEHCSIWVETVDSDIVETAELINRGDYNIEAESKWYSYLDDPDIPLDVLGLVNYMIGLHDRRGQALREVAMERMKDKRVNSLNIHGRNVMCINNIYHDYFHRNNLYGRFDDISVEVMVMRDLFDRIGIWWDC